MEKQNIEIRRLTPELCEDWVKFFDDIAFKDHEDWAFCYCLEGHLDRKTQQEWTNTMERRKKAIELIQNGEMQGYLAYEDNKVIGWCNVNDRENYRYLMTMFEEIGYQTKQDNNLKIKSIFCFLIYPQHRGRGVAHKLLDKVCEDALKEGYAYIETYPFGDGGFEFQYHGTQKMYERNNFTEAADFEFVKVMRKSLR